MTFPGFQQPEHEGLALVLSGGGARAAYQVGTLTAIAERMPDLRFPILTGVSAGAINISYLAAHGGNLRAAVEGLRSEWARLTPDQVYCVRPFHLVRSSIRWLFQILPGRGSGQGTLRGLMDGSPLRRFLQGCIGLSGIRQNITQGRLRAVALSATSYTTGQTVTFMQGVPEIPVWERVQRIGVRIDITLDHVMASSAIPIVFPAVRLPDGFYGDGSVRQIAPLAPAIHLGARRILAIAMRATRVASVPLRPVGEYPATAEVIGLLFNTIFMDSLDADAERLERINDVLEKLTGGAPAPSGLRPVKLLLLRPSRDLGVLSRGHVNRLPKAVRWVVSGLGGKREGGSDFVSYLLFHPAYTDRLVDLGYSDAHAQWARIEEFLDGGR